MLRVLHHFHSVDPHLAHRPPHRPVHLRALGTGVDIGVECYLGETQLCVEQCRSVGTGFVYLCVLLYVRVFSFFS